MKKDWSITGNFRQVIHIGNSFALEYAITRVRVSAGLSLISDDLPLPIFQRALQESRELEE
jgi:hypothetical protein